MVDFKNLLLEWIILLVFAVILWYRNYLIDRAISIFIGITATIQLIFYGIYNGGSIIQANNIIYLLLWTQCLSLMIGCYLIVNYNDQYTEVNKTIKSIIWWLFITYSVIFIVFLIILLISGIKSPMEIIINDNEMPRITSTYLDIYVVLYIVGILSPIILMSIIYYNTHPEVMILPIFMIGSIIYILLNYSIEDFIYSWNHTFIIVPFIIYIIGIVYKP